MPAVEAERPSNTGARRSSKAPRPSAVSRQKAGSVRSATAWKWVDWLLLGEYRRDFIEGHSEKEWVVNPAGLSGPQVRRRKPWLKPPFDGPQQALLGELGQPHRVELVFSELNRS